MYKKTIIENAKLISPNPPKRYIGFVKYLSKNFNTKISKITL